MNDHKQRVSIVGTNGIPAVYGGYETLAENLTKYLSDDFDFIVYCSKTQPKHYPIYNQATLKYVPLNANGWQSILYDIYSLIHASVTSDIVLYLGPTAGFMIPAINFFAKKVFIVNHGGLKEWEREKYTRFQKFVAKLGHQYAARHAAINVADNLQLKETLKNEFGTDSRVIRYGGDHVMKVPIDDELTIKYPFIRDDYFVNISRAQVDNNLHLVLEAFKTLPEKKLVMISNWSISTYGKNLKNAYKDKFSNIFILDAIYKARELNAIRGNAQAYIHSHSFCGTSPSLVEAMSLGLPIFCFDVPTNRETTRSKAFFFKKSFELKDMVISLQKEDLIANGLEMKKIASDEYSWHLVSMQYAAIFRQKWSS